MIADPKQGKRRVSRRAVQSKMLREVECRAGCGRRAATAHHLIQKGAPHFGDDEWGNIVGLCGHGTAGCHGAVHGNPYVDEDGERWDAERVNRGIGERLADSEIIYFLSKLGLNPGWDYLRRVYYVDGP